MSYVVHTRPADLPPMPRYNMDDDLKTNVFAVGDKVLVIGNMVGDLFRDTAAFRTGVAFEVTDVKQGWLYTVNGMTYMQEALVHAK